ncbi:MAG: hypothetical protein JNM63_17120, partial [Spirochaetia bacterium]|nr:hypothetical protein [Spirochaetia bacterium]
MKTMHFFSAMAVGLCLAACSVRVFDSAEDLADSPNGISPSFAAAPPSPTKSPGGNFPALAYFKLTLPTGS